MKCPKCGGKVETVIEGEWIWSVCGGYQAFYADEPPEGSCGAVLDEGAAIYDPEHPGAVGFAWNSSQNEGPSDEELRAYGDLSQY